MSGRRLKAPGSCLERLLAFIWYGLIQSVILGYVSILQEILHKIKKPKYEALPRRTGQVVVLTGGTRGIGALVLKKLLQLDYSVILGVRNTFDGQKAIDKARKKGVQSGNAKCLQLDLKSLSSVRTFAQKTLRETDRIDLLINNAGIMFEPYEVTEDGLEAHFQVNYLSHFLLTQLLLPKITSTGAGKMANCRVINVSSTAHIASRGEDIADYLNPSVYSAFKAYYDSKLCQILSTKFLNSRLSETNVNIYAVHPGVIPTDLYKSLHIFGKIAQLLKCFFRSVENGADEVMYVAISPDLQNRGGSYISNTSVQNPSQVAEDLRLQKLLWDLSQNCIERK